MRLGIIEMIQFTQLLFPKTKVDTFFESCGIADVIASSLGGRNHKVSVEFVKTGKPIHVLEDELLKGQKLQGPPTAAEVNHMLKERNMEDKYCVLRYVKLLLLVLLCRFPIFTAVHKICQKEIKAEELGNCLKNHPVHDVI